MSQNTEMFSLNHPSLTPNRFNFETKNRALYITALINCFFLFTKQNGNIPKQSVIQVRVTESKATQNNMKKIGHIFCKQFISTTITSPTSHSQS